MTLGVQTDQLEVAAKACHWAQLWAALPPEYPVSGLHGREVRVTVTGRPAITGPCRCRAGLRLDHAIA